MEGYVPILLASLVALSVPILILLLARILMRRKPNPVKSEPYECGNPIEHQAHDFRFSIRYYIIAVLFVIFDVETVFLYPWAVTLKKLALFGFIEMIVFLAILVVGYVYAWKKEALKWA
ncbi:MAG TPA: NADH-quinone oxidoreductase subunit A [Thermoanaerobaculia bacterium]|nr:NADH-quinone oxidoreductase subunit A [Thermoanaerobaculia bacterium]HUM29553.1 NADH-quinone oxidoreductase subunit A [Thermoanaerobaculia bacterium]HXK67936.1 NADH-quinone oxidoreductase subunit A [Thermoanaerobaculia bacterium]